MTERLVKYFTVTQKALILTVWISSALFGLYILMHYFGAIFTDNLQNWNSLLPNLYIRGGDSSNFSIGLHFLFGGVLLILSYIQFLNIIRLKWPKFHRITGRIYLISCVLTAVGGLFFIFERGTIGGPVMDVGFGIYGILMLAVPIFVLKTALKRDFKQHQRWARYLFALVIASWLYRMEYGTWMLFTENLGMEKNFRGWFDKIMAFFFYVPNIIIVYFINKDKLVENRLTLMMGTLVFMISTCFLIISTVYVSKELWLLPILNLFSKT